MAKTTNLGLDKVTTAQTNLDFYNAFNGNMEILDGKPFPVGVTDNSGSSNALSAMKFADGTLVMWGKIDHGTSKPVNIQWVGNGGDGYASEAWTVSFPFNCTTPPVVIPWCVDSGRCETFIISAAPITESTASFRYWSGVRDNGGSKTAHILVIGRWQ